MPKAAGAQVPSVPALSQRSHGPVHALSQQRPSEQKPVAQALAAVQVVPFASFGTHVPELQ